MANVDVNAPVHTVRFLDEMSIPHPVVALLPPTRTESCDVMTMYPTSRTKKKLIKQNTTTLTTSPPKATADATKLSSTKTLLVQGRSNVSVNNTRTIVVHSGRLDTCPDAKYLNTREPESAYVRPMTTNSNPVTTEW